jgi:hypothetical protein
MQRSFYDILDDLHSLFPKAATSTTTTTSSETLSELEQAVLEVLDSTETALDFIVGKTRLPSQKVASTLLALEMKRLVTSRTVSKATLDAGSDRFRRAIHQLPYSCSVLVSTPSESKSKFFL